MLSAAAEVDMILSSGTADRRPEIADSEADNDENISAASYMDLTNLTVETPQRRKLETVKTPVLKRAGGKESTATPKSSKRAMVFPPAAPTRDVSAKKAKKGISTKSPAFAPVRLEFQDTSNLPLPMLRSDAAVGVEQSSLITGKVGAILMARHKSDTFTPQLLTETLQEGSFMLGKLDIISYLDKAIECEADGDDKMMKYYQDLVAVAIQTNDNRTAAKRARVISQQVHREISSGHRSEANKYVRGFGVFPCPPGSFFLSAEEYGPGVDLPTLYKKLQGTPKFATMTNETQLNSFYRNFIYSIVDNAYDLRNKHWVTSRIQWKDNGLIDMDKETVLSFMNIVTRRGGDPMWPLNDALTEETVRAANYATIGYFLESARKRFRRIYTKKMGSNLPANPDDQMETAEHDEFGGDDDENDNEDELSAS